MIIYFTEEVISEPLQNVRSTRQFWEQKFTQDCDSPTMERKPPGEGSENDDTQRSSSSSSAGDIKRSSPFADLRKQWNMGSCQELDDTQTVDVKRSNKSHLQNNQNKKYVEVVNRKENAEGEMVSAGQDNDQVDDEHPLNVKTLKEKWEQKIVQMLDMDVDYDEESDQCDGEQENASEEEYAQEGVDQSGDEIEVVDQSGDEIEVLDQSEHEIDVMDQSGDEIEVMDQSGEKIEVVDQSGDEIEVVNQSDDAHGSGNRSEDEIGTEDQSEKLKQTVYQSEDSHETMKQNACNSSHADDENEQSSQSSETGKVEEYVKKMDDIASENKADMVTGNSSDDLDMNTENIDTLSAVTDTCNQSDIVEQQTGVEMRITKEDIGNRDEEESEKHISDKKNGVEIQDISTDSEGVLQLTENDLLRGNIADLSGKGHKRSGIYVVSES